MPESFTQVPPNSTGNKMRTRSRVIGSNTVHEQAIFQDALPTYYALADAVGFAANKHMISLYNASGSGKLVVLKKLCLVNLQLTTVTGVAVRQNFSRFSAVHSAGTLITPTSNDSLNPAIPAGITVRTGATLTAGSLLFPLTFANDEVSATQAFPSVPLQWLPEGNEVQEVRLREGEGVTVQNITSTVIGSFAYMFVFTLDDL